MSCSQDVMLITDDVTARSIIVTSGTLSPMDSFAGEIATKFPHNVQTNHVINVNKQVIPEMYCDPLIDTCQIWVGALAPKTVKFNSVFTNSVSFEYQGNAVYFSVCPN